MFPSNIFHHERGKDVTEELLKLHENQKQSKIKSAMDNQHHKLPKHQPQKNKEKSHAFNVRQSFSSLQDPSLTDYSITILDNFRWINIFSGDFNITTFTGIDQAREVSIPFIFKFYGFYTTLMYVTSNGWITFDVETIFSHFNGELIVSSFPLAPGHGKLLVAPLFSEYFQYPKENVSMSVTVAISNNLVVIEHETRDALIPSTNDSTPAVTFQIVLAVNGSIYYNYRHVASQVIDLYRTTIGLNHGDGIHFNEIDPNSILREDNMSIAFSYPQLDQDVAVRITRSALYVPVVNDTQNVSIVVTNLGKKKTTNFTVLAWLNQSVIINLTFSLKNGSTLSQLDPEQSYLVTIQLQIPSEQGVNITTMILSTNSSEKSYRDQNIDNNRHERLFSVVNAMDLPSIQVQAIIANTSRPLEGAHITIKESHGLIEVKGVTNAQGRYNTSKINLRSDLLTNREWIFLVTALHSRWGTYSAQVTVPINDKKNEENIMRTKIYLGPGKVQINAPDESKIITRGIYPLTISITPSEKISEIINVTVMTNANHTLVFTDLPFQLDSNDSSRASVIVHVPLSPDVSKNLIALRIYWEQNFVTQWKVTISHTALEPLFTPQPGDWIHYLHDRPVEMDRYYNLTFLQWTSTSEILVFATVNPVNSPNADVITEYFTVNVYNGIINSSHLSIDPNYQRFFFLTGLTLENANVGTIFNLNDWISTYKIVSGELDSFGPTWISFDTKAHFSSNSRMLRTSGLLTYFIDNGIELELINSSFLGFPRKNLERVMEQSRMQSDFIETVLNMRIPSMSLITWLTALIMMMLVNIRKKRRAT